MTETTFKIRMPAEVRTMCLVEQSMASWFMSSAETPISRAEFQASGSVEVDASSEFTATGDSFWDNEESRWFRPFNVVRAADGTGVLVISVKGSLYADLTGQFGNWATGYPYVTAAVKRGVSDTTIKAIVLDINSPGGMVRGCSECGDAIAEAAKIKPVIAYAQDTAASAAYWLAAQSTELHVSNTGEVGSIGVITGHWDESEWLKQMGIKYTPLFAGERKADMSPYLPINDEAKAAMQKRLNAVYSEFISAVARGRGMNGDDIRNTQAAMFASQESVRIGLADRVSTRAEVMSAAFGAQLETQAETETDNDQGQDMTDKSEDTTKAITPEAITPAQPVAPKVTAEQPDAGAIEAAVYKRVGDILACDEAKGREALANKLAFTTKLSFDEVKGLLAAAPVAAPTNAHINPFETVMMSTPNPDVGAGGQPGEESDVLAAYRAAQI
ncbi:S49 family peptidase [Paenirhodobacter populi]|uniref:S49 family peptidase n=1 Tax=Paenirhodobacter populi TaxID=2306993 RepID=A0A443IZU7_9RHOB|nr:S49 family peptidase [Sinirhodobacter populi]RWR13835.1 S49 family peptidase [Sinirhodobacter populi]